MSAFSHEIHVHLHQMCRRAFDPREVPKRAGRLNSQRDGSDALGKRKSITDPVPVVLDELTIRSVPAQAPQSLYTREAE